MEHQRMEDDQARETQTHLLCLRLGLQRRRLWLTVRSRASLVLAARIEGLAILKLLRGMEGAVPALLGCVLARSVEARSLSVSLLGPSARVGKEAAPCPGLRPLRASHPRR
jgi:hypothetical protein